MRPDAADALLLFAAIGCFAPPPRLRDCPTRGILDCAGEVLLSLRAGAMMTAPMRSVLEAARRATNARVAGAWPALAKAADPSSALPHDVHLTCPLLWATAWLAEELARQGIASMRVWRCLGAIGAAAASPWPSSNLGAVCESLLAELDHWQPSRILARAFADGADG